MPLKNPKAKGSRIEREVKRAFEENGFKVIRSAGSHGEGDLYVEGLGAVQVKARKNFGIYKFLESIDALVIKANYKEPLIVISLEKFLKVCCKGVADGRT